MMTSPTKLLYLEDFTGLECEASVLEVIREGEKEILILDQTIFYPQGGGQPYDTGVVESPSGQFAVEEVRFVDGVVRHIGQTEKGTIAKSDKVRCLIDKDRRELMSRLHSAGHVVDLAVTELNLDWVPGKGYHFPDGPYVEYRGALGGDDKEKLRAEIEQRSNAVIQEGREVTIRFMAKEEMHTVCHFVPDYIPEGKPGRVVSFGDPSTGSGQVFGVPCGGTHVRNLKEINRMTIRKIKTGNGTIRLSYDVMRDQ